MGTDYSNCRLGIQLLFILALLFPSGTISAQPDVSHAYSGTFLDISAETLNARATFWKPDGSMVFVVGRYSDNIAAYEVDEPWEIGSARFIKEEKIPGEFQHGLYFRQDGRMMWVFDRTSIWSYNLERPWDITTRSEGENTDLSHIVERGHDIDFKPDGSLLYIDDRNTGAVFALSLPVPWDVSTGNITATLDISEEQVEVRGIEFMDDGTLMFLMDTGRGEILKYKLSVPYDILTAELAGTFDVSAQTLQGRGLSFSAGMDRFYVTGRDEEKIFQYDLLPKRTSN